LLLLLWLAKNLPQAGNDRLIVWAVTALLLEIYKGVQLELKVVTLMCFGGATAQLEFDLGE
jgi:hypothetical protein